MAADVAHVVIGGGAVGLAVAARLARYGSTIVLERNARIGEETSSRNSEVIHGGIYYPVDSLKTRLCIAGRQLIYRAADASGIPYRKVGKWIVAQDDAEAAVLQGIHDRATKLGVPMRWVPTEEQRRLEPHVRSVRTLESPETGVLDSHAFMLWLQGQLESRDGSIALNTNVTDVRFHGAAAVGVGGARYTVRTPEMEITASVVVNSAGLASDRVARLVMQERTPPEYKLYYCKGCYYAYTGASPVSRLVYPVPPPGLAGLGVHATVDMGGRMRLGPDTEYVDHANDYTVGPSRLQTIRDAALRYLPGLDTSRLIPDYSGIRPKLSAPGEPARDFVIEHEEARGFPGLVNLVGIESPGLTSSMAIADLVAAKLGYRVDDWVA